MIRIESNVLGPRLFVFGHRWHHFHFGLWMVALGVAGAYLVVKDRADLLDWICR